MKSVFYLWLLIGVLFVGTADLCIADVAKDLAGEQLQVDEKADPRDNPAFHKEMAEAMFLVTLFVAAGFFLFVLMITLVRFTRNYRSRMKIGQRGEKTEYIDAWSRYKIKEEEEEK